MMAIPRNEPRERRTSNDLGSEVLPGIYSIDSIILSLLWSSLGPWGACGAGFFFFFSAPLYGKKANFRVPFRETNLRVV